MSGNKTDNGVLEIGTDEIRASYSEDTPGQNVEQYIKEREKAVHEAKDRAKKQFGAVFNNPLKGYPYNEAIKVTPIKESFEELLEVKKFNSSKELAAIKKMDKSLESVYKDMNKLQYGKSLYLMKVNDGIVEARRGISTYQAAIENGELETGSKRVPSKEDVQEGKMGDLFLDIQNGATAKEIAKDYPVTLQQAKDFLKDYYSQKKKPLKMGEETKDEVEEGGSLAQKAAIAISKKEKAGKPGYDKEGKSLKNK